eukprot:1195174-Prorocentrum_minimum.AAC.4
MHTSNSQAYKSGTTIVQKSKRECTLDVLGAGGTKESFPTSVVYRGATCKSSLSEKTFRLARATVGPQTCESLLRVSLNSWVGLTNLSAPEKLLVTVITKAPSDSHGLVPVRSAPIRSLDVPRVGAGPSPVLHLVGGHVVVPGQNPPRP